MAVLGICSFTGLAAGQVLAPRLRCSVACSTAQERGDVAGTLCYSHDLDGTAFRTVNYEAGADRPE